MEEQKEFHQKTKPKFVKISDIKPGPQSDGYNVFVQVLEVKIETTKRNDDTVLSIAEGKVGDETGTINFRVAGDYAKILQKGSTVSWRNGKSEVFKERHRLGLDRWGKIQQENNDKVGNVNTDPSKDLSAIEYVKKIVNSDDRNRGEDRRGDRRRFNNNRRYDNRGGDRDRRDERDRRDNRYQNKGERRERGSRHKDSQDN